MKTLSKLFGGEARVKILRLFLLNQEQPFTLKQIALRARIPLGVARAEMSELASGSFVKPKKFVETFITEKKNKRTKKITQKRMVKKASGFVFNPDFPYLHSLRALLFDSDFLKRDDLIARFKKIGRIKLLIISGIFLQDPESRLDILVVGDNLKRSAVETTIKVLESEIGKELSYAVFDTPDFQYRLNMYDKLVRDVFDYPHESLLDTAGLSTPALKR